MSASPVFRIRPTAQSYDWGKPAPTSRVYAYAQASQISALDASKPYAELWMGTHPTSPSKIFDSDLTLADHLKAHPELLGSGNRKTELPFLFKVLAINKALSIQSHPDKKTAERLFETQSHIYKGEKYEYWTNCVEYGPLVLYTLASQFKPR
jgi:mannose-6-phosphate isomerase